MVLITTSRQSERQHHLELTRLAPMAQQRSLLLTDLIDEQGRVRVGTLDIYPVFEPTRLMVNQTYDIDCPGD